MAIELDTLQRQIFANKVKKGFNTTDISWEFCRAYEELAEAFSKVNRQDPSAAEEFADVTIFLLGMCEMLGYSLEEELVRKVDINEKRKYKRHITPDGKHIHIRIKTRQDP